MLISDPQFDAKYVKQKKLKDYLSPSILKLEPRASKVQLEHVAAIYSLTNSHLLKKNSYLFSSESFGQHIEHSQRCNRHSLECQHQRGGDQRDNELIESAKSARRLVHQRVAAAGGEQQEEAATDRQ